MKLKAQINNERMLAHRASKEAKKHNDIESEWMFRGMMMALDWVQGSRDVDYSFVEYNKKEY